MNSLADDIALLRLVLDVCRMVITNPAIAPRRDTIKDLNERVAVVLFAPRDYRVITLVTTILIDTTDALALARADGNDVNVARFSFYAERALRDSEMDLINAEKSTGQ